MGLKPIDRWANEGPDFNRAVADAVYGTVMKMDADEAVMFTRLVADAALEDDLMVHGELIAKTLNAQAAARAEVLKGHLARTAIVKARRGENADRELVALDTISKNFIGDLFSHDKRAERARKQQRGVGTGQFVRQTNDIVHTGVPHSDAHAVKLGIPTTAKIETEDGKGKKTEELWSPKERAAFQEAYHQVSELIKPYQRLPEGSAFVHLVDDKGDEKIHRIPGAGKKLDGALFDPKDGRKIVRTRISVLPPEDEQGAVFGAFDAVGMPNVGATMAGATKDGALDANRLTNFTDQIRQPTDEHRPSDKVFRRLGSSASLLQDTFGDVAPPQAKMALAVARHVGGYGPAATKLIGPTADRAAYRYRGTERDVDPRLQMAMEDDARTANQHVARNGSSAAGAGRAIRESEARRDDQLNRNAVTFNQHVGRIRNDWEQAARSRQAGLLSRGDYKNAIKHAQGETKRLQAARVASDTAAHKQHQETVSAAERTIKNGEADRAAYHQHLLSHGYKGDDERWKQSQVIGYMRSRVPSADLAQLHLTAGTVPPSEGVILDSKGNVTSQAVGYGDDHYLPFTLKGMRKMRGGSYIRTRTWGGPTAEDIRTSLIGGAKSLTVVSNNGVFNVDFADDFTGGRRHNDKAHRMIGRYEHLLDAVKNGNVTRADIDPSRMEVLEREAAARVNPQYNPDGYKKELKRREAEERKNPTLSVAQRDAVAEEFAHGLASEHGHGDVNSLLEDLATRRARASIIATRQANEKFNRENPDRAIGLGTPPSVEVLKQGELDKLRSDSPQVLATNLAGALGRGKDLDATYKEAEQTNRENLRELRLNGTGYKAAMDALKQQFPYYIKSVSFERFADRPNRTDTGYVRPGATRPGAAQSGMFDSLTSSRKVNADTTRGQGVGLGRRAVEAVQAATSTTSDDADPARATAPEAGNPEELQKQVNRAMLRELLRQTEFAPKTTVTNDAGERVEIGGADMRVEAASPKNTLYPKSLLPFYGPGVDEDQLYEQLDSDPRAMGEKVRAAVRWLDNHQGHWEGDTDYASALKDFKTGGKVGAAADTTDTGAIVDRPEREYSWAHTQGDAYVPHQPGVTAEQVTNAYLRDPLISEHVRSEALPPTLDDPAFPDKVKGLTATLRRQDRQMAQWKARGGIDRPPVDEATHDAQVRGLVHAYTLERRLGEAKAADAARAAAEQAASAARADEYRHKEAMAAHETPQQIIDLAAWSDEDRARLGDANDPLAEETAARYEQRGDHELARTFRKAVALHRAQQGEPWLQPAAESPGLRATEQREREDLARARQLGYGG